jgi:hypothetical protein
MQDFLVWCAPAVWQRKRLEAKKGGRLGPLGLGRARSFSGYRFALSIEVTLPEVR